MSIIFEIIDRTRRRIRLTRSQWGHIMEHPEMTNKLEHIKETLHYPQRIVAGARDPSRRYYIRHYKQAHGKFLIVMVKYLNGHGFIITAYHSSKPQP